MKLLFVVSSLDLTQPFSATPAWWQLMKGLYEIGVEVIATPYQGPAIESLWWRAAANPAKWQGDTFKAARDMMGKRSPHPRPLSAGVGRGENLTPPAPRRNKFRPEFREGGVTLPVEGDVGAPLPHPLPTSVGRGENLTPSASHSQATGEKSAVENQESGMDRLVRGVAQTLIAPLWERHLDKLLTKEPDIDAVIVLTAPLNQIKGVAKAIIQKHRKPVFYYDGDVPASLPNMRGFASGFRIYQGSDPAEFTAFISNSMGGGEAIRALGARAVHTLYYGADPDVFSPVEVASQDIDVMFYGHGREYRGEWIDAMLAQPAAALPDLKFAVRGTKLGDLGRVQLLPYLSFSKLREYACRSKINLCITRAAHANVYASSSSRPFELAGMGCCIVANPYQGIENWFEPGKEVIVVQSQEEAVDRYRWLIDHSDERLAMGRAARERLLKEHTFVHRARELVGIVQGYL